MRVLVVTARGLQLNAVACYGNLWIDTPTFNVLAAEGIVFDHHFAGGADPERARREWRSGRYHLPAPEGFPDDAPGDDLLAALRARGIPTRLVLDASRPAPPGFEAGWDEVERVKAAEGEGSLEATVEAARAALHQLAGRDDWLLWVDLGTPLPPWDVPEEFQAEYFEEVVEEDEEDEESAEGTAPAEPAEPLEPLTDFPPGPIDPADDVLYFRLHSSYAAAVSYLDAGVGQLLEALGDFEAGNEVLVLFTTDCGQALGEHDVVGPHDEVIHLPLLVRLPGGDEAGRRVGALTQAVDLAPTLADVFELPLPSAHGHSLLPLVYGEAEAVRPYACSGAEAGGQVDWALRTPEWALLLPAEAEENPARGPLLYVKPDDRWEVNNVVQHHLDLGEHFEQTLREFVRATRQPGPLQTPALRDVEAETAAIRSGPPQPGCLPKNSSRHADDDGT